MFTKFQRRLANGAPRVRLGAAQVSRRRFHVPRVGELQQSGAGALARPPMTTGLLVEHPLRTPSTSVILDDDDGWASLADVHALSQAEVAQLMGCAAMVVDESWQVVVIDAQMRQADGECRTDRLARLLCLLIRAEVAEGVGGEEAVGVLRLKPDCLRADDGLH